MPIGQHWSNAKKAGVIIASIVGFIAALVGVLPYITGSSKAPWVADEPPAAPIVATVVVATPAAPVAVATLTTVTDTSQFEGAIGKPVGNFVFPNKSTPTELPMPNPPTLEGAHNWAMENGGVDNLSSYVQFFLGAQHGSVQLIGAKVNIIDHLPPPPPGALIASCQCGEQLMVRNLTVSLDQQTVESYDDSGNTLPITYTMKDGEVEQFVVHALNNKCSCSWTLTLSLLVDGEPQTKVVDDNGAPFKLMAAYGPSYNLINGVWVLKK